MPRNPTPPKPPPSPIYFPISSCLCLREHASTRSNRTMSWSLAAHRRIVLRSKVRRPLFLSLPAFFSFQLRCTHWPWRIGALVWCSLGLSRREHARPADQHRGHRPSAPPQHRRGGPQLASGLPTRRHGQPVRQPCTRGEPPWPGAANQPGHEIRPGQ